MFLKDPWRPHAWSHPKRQVPLFLFDARAFADLAPINGIREPERQLIHARKLTPLQIGRSRYYDWREVLALMPEANRARLGKLAALVEESTKAAAR